MLVAEYAMLSRETYKIKDTAQDTYNLPEGWLINRCKSCEQPEMDNNTKAIWGNLYVQFINNNKKEIVLSIRGTDNVLNAVTDIGLAISSICQNVSFIPPGQHELEEFVEDILASETIKFHDYTFKIIGHSLGGVMAELVAVKYGIECITFESPGSLHIMSQFPQEYPTNNFRYITNYLAAPNIINTLNRHPGTIYRMFLPHVEGIRWLHVGECLLNSIYSAASYVAIIASPTTLLCGATTKKLITNIAKQSFLTAVGTKLLNHLIDWTDDINYIGSQHNIEKIADFLLHDGEIAEVQSWPIIWDIVSSNTLLNFIKDLIPWQKDMPGIRNIFDENGMKEAQINRFVSYVDYNEITENSMFSKLLTYKL